MQTYKDVVAKFKEKNSKTPKTTWRYESWGDSYEQGGRVGYQSGQLVDHGPGRQGYAGDTAGFRKDIITFKGKELPKGFILDKANEFGINRKTASMIIDELRPDIRKLPYPENKEAKRRRLVVEKRLKKNFLNNAEFIKLHKNFEGSDLKFAEFLNEKGFTTDRGGNFTEGAVYSRRDQLNLKTKTLPQSMSSYKTEAEKLGIDIKGMNDQTIKTRVRERRRELIRQQKRLTDPDFAAKETATRKAWEKANPEKVKKAKFKARVKSYEKTGMIQPVENAKEELWRSLFEDGKRYTEGRRLKIEGDYGRYVSRERFLNAKILDTKTGKTITFKNLENYINPKNTGKTYAQVIKPYDQKWFVNDTPGLRTEINSKLIPNWTSASKQNFFQIQHNAGRYKDPFDVSLSNNSLNLKESQVRTKFEKMWNASDNLSDKKKAFKFYKENLPNEILSKPSMVTRSRYFGEEVPLDKQLRTLKESGVNLPGGTLKKVELLFQQFCNYGSYAEGGRIGFKAGSCSTEVAAKNFARASEDLVQGRVTGKAGQELAEKIGTVSKAGSKGMFSKLLGPYGIGLDVVFEAGMIGTDVLKGKPLNEAVADNWITGAAYKTFTGKTGEKLLNERLAKLDSSTKIMGNAMNLFSEVEDLNKELARMEADRQVSTTNLGKKEIEKIKAEIAKKTKEFNTLTKDGTLIEPGTPAYESYYNQLTELRDSDRAKSIYSKIGDATVTDFTSDRYVPREKAETVLPENYSTFKPNLLTQNEILNYAKEQNINVTPQQADEFIIENKWRQLMEQPGMKGTQDKFFNAGGRVSFKGGGIDKGRRAFMKLLAALGIGTATAGTGLIKLGGKAATKTAVKTGADIVSGTPGMPSWFPALVNKIIKEGDDVTAKLATQERQVVHTKKLPDGEEATVYRDLDTGDVRVDYDSVSNMGEGTAPVSLEYKAPSVIDEGKMAGKKTDPEFSAVESEPVSYTHGPDDYSIEWDGSNVVGKVDDLVSDTSKLKNYAKSEKPTMKDIVTRKRKIDEVDAIHKNETDYISTKQGEGEWDDYLPDIDDID